MEAVEHTRPPRTGFAPYAQIVVNGEVNPLHARKVRSQSRRLLFNVLGMLAEFESDLIRARTREGMATAKVRGQLKGRKPKLSPVQERHMVALPRAGDHTVAELVELFGVGRTTVYRALERHPAAVDSAVTLPRADA